MRRHGAQLLAGVTAAAFAFLPLPAFARLSPSSQASSYAQLAPAAGAESEAAPAVSLPQAASPDDVPKNPSPKPSVAPATQPAAAAKEPAKEPEGDDSVLVAPGQEQSKPAINARGELSISVSAAADSVILRFPFSERVAMATFTRGHFLWVVFNKVLPLDFSEFKEMGQTVIGQPQLLVSGGMTLLRMPVENTVAPSVLQEDGSSGWTIEISGRKRPLKAPLNVEVSLDPPAPPHVFLAVEEAGDTVLVKDPQIGDEMVIVPVYAPGKGVGGRREFIEFSLLPTAQGIAVVKKADGVAVTSLRNGLRIAVGNGQTLTRALPQLQQQDSAAASLIDSSTFFPYDLWKPENPDNPHPQLSRLQQKIVSAETPQEGNEARLRLAQIYLSQGMAAEALAFLDGIQRVNPAYYRSAKLAAMHGAANMLMYRYPEAANDFNAAELNNSREAEYWRSMLADLLGGNGQEYDYLTLNQDYVSKYPPIFRQRLAIFAADRAIGGKNYNTALKIFDALQKDMQLGPIEPYVNFLLAKISADTGQAKEATEMWDKLADDHNYPLVQARAEFSRIAWGMEHGSLDKEDAIERLERLRLSWHGDALELSVLTLLGDLYAEKNDYINAMRIWHGGIQSFGSTKEAGIMTQKMQSAFITMFNEGGADILPPLDSLALYYEYRKYTPPGLAGGEMIERLADRLVTVDLLDQAAFMIDQQMRSQAEKETRSRLGAKLATIALLNRQPKRAMTALEASVYGENEPVLRQLRNRLAAQAMVDLGQPAQALQTLGQDNTQDANLIRLNVHWSQKDWPGVIKTAEAMLKERKDITSQLTAKESEAVVKLALAYSFENDNAQLQYLHDYFLPLMENNPQKQVFEFVTNPSPTPSPTNFDEIVESLSRTRSFLDQYRARAPVAVQNPS